MKSRKKCCNREQGTGNRGEKKIGKGIGIGSIKLYTV
jgi:hypothetical protein